MVWIGRGRARGECRGIDDNEWHVAGKGGADSWKTELQSTREGNYMICLPL